MQFVQVFGFKVVVAQLHPAGVVVEVEEVEGPEVVVELQELVNTVCC